MIKFALVFAVFLCRFLSAMPVSDLEPLQRGCMLANRYEILSQLGEGGYAKVMLAKDRATGNEVAIKIYHNMKLADIEVAVFRLLMDSKEPVPPEIVMPIRLFQYLGADYIVLPVMKGDLVHYVEKLPDNRMSMALVKRVGRQVLKALSFLHERNIVSNDVKPENLLIRSYDPFEVSLIDFSNSCFEGVPECYSGSPLFDAPEVKLGHRPSPASDMWSFAVMMIEFYTGYAAFDFGGSLVFDPQFFDAVAAFAGPVPVESDIFRQAPKKEKAKYFTRDTKLLPYIPSYKFKMALNAWRADELTFLRPRESDDLKDLRLLMDLMKRCFKWMPNERLTAKEVLAHPFFKTDGAIAENVETVIAEFNSVSISGAAHAEGVSILVDNGSLDRSLFAQSQNTDSLSRSTATLSNNENSLKPSGSKNVQKPTQNQVCPKAGKKGFFSCFSAD